MRRPILLAGLLAVTASLAACASDPKPRLPTRAPTPHGAPRPVARRPAASSRPVTAPSPYPTASLQGAQPLTSIPGWSEEDHAAALVAFAAGCGAAHDTAMRGACQRARAMGSAGEGAAKAFFEREFRAEALPGEGVLTAYFAPEYAARRSPEGAYTAPVRAKPSASAVTTYVTAAAPPPSVVTPQTDVIDRVLSGLNRETEEDQSPALALPTRPQAAPPVSVPASAPVYVPSQGRGGQVALATADRTTIETSPAPDALAWMRPEELFFLQIQGSGTLVFPDGARAKAIYAADNGKPFVAIARPMVAQGLLTTGKASGEGIRAWLAAHAGREADAVMRQNPRYVFFAMLPDDGREPAGAAGIPLPAGRSLAVDPGRHTYGELYWIDASAPILTGATRRYRRLAVALDTGAAIRGEVRADLYIGRGGAAGEEAGRVRHTLHMVRLVPVGALGGGG